MAPLGFAAKAAQTLFSTKLFIATSPTALCLPSIVALTIPGGDVTDGRDAVSASAMGVGA